MVLSWEKNINLISSNIGLGPIIYLERMLYFTCLSYDYQEPSNFPFY